MKRRANMIIKNKNFKTINSAKFQNSKLAQSKNEAVF